MESDSTGDKQGSNSIKASDVVLNTNGRDAGGLFFVLTAGDGYASIADGRSRLVEKPKRKKLKHLLKVEVNATRVSEKLQSGVKVTNAELRRCLRDITKTAEESVTNISGGVL